MPGKKLQLSGNKLLLETDFKAVEIYRMKIQNFVP